MVNEYKKLENNLVQRVVNVFSAVGKRITAFFQGVVCRVLKQHYTVVFVPHSEKNVFSFQLSLVPVFCFLFIVIGIISVMFYYAVSYNSEKYTLTEKETQLNIAEADLNIMLKETAALIREAANFETTLSKTLSVFEKDIEHNSSYHVPPEDFPALFTGDKDSAEICLKEIEYLRHFSEYIKSAREPLREAGASLGNQIELFKEIPYIWPVKGNIGIITSYFGARVHPVTGVRDFHEAIDIAAKYGIPVVSTANGQVVLTEYDRGYGNNIVIRHKYGYYTRYAHMQNFAVHSGQIIKQGDVIGYIGSSGLSTGPHLHYQVRIGPAAVNPYTFITMVKK
jgi:murein DD-endopeptidase MepM/ murein hydrolase activator NlpD